MVNYLSTFWPIISADFCRKWKHLTLLGSKLSMVGFERSIALHRHHIQDDRVMDNAIDGRHYVG